jgi:Flp pilus assembly protein TadD
MEVLQTGLQHIPNDPSLTERLARQKMATGDMTQALAVLDDFIVTQASAEAGVHELRGDVLIALERDDEAVSAYTQALVSLKDHVRLVVILKKLLKLEPWAKLVPPLAKRVDAHPDNVQVRLLLANALTFRGDYAAARKQWLYILAKQPDNVTALNGLATVYTLEDEFDQALDYAERAHHLDPIDPSAMDTLGWVLVQRGDTDQGLALIQDARVDRLDSLEVAYHLAAALLKHGDRAQARRVVMDVDMTGAKFPGHEQAQRLWRELGAK